MADYSKMYALLVDAIEDTLESLSRIPLAQPCANRLIRALLKAEKIYIESSSYLENPHGNLSVLLSDRSGKKDQS